MIEAAKSLNGGCPNDDTSDETSLGQTEHGLSCIWLLLPAGIHFGQRYRYSEQKDRNQREALFESDAGLSLSNIAFFGPFQEDRSCRPLLRPNVPRRRSEADNNMQFSQCLRSVGLLLALVWQNAIGARHVIVG